MLLFLIGSKPCASLVQVYLYLYLEFKTKLKCDSHYTFFLITKVQ